MPKIALHWQIIISLILGVIWSIIATYAGWSNFTVLWLKPFGTIFINLLKLVAIPLVLFSIIGGIANLSELSDFKTMGLRTLGLYMVTTTLSISLGLVIANVIAPGERIEESMRIKNRIQYEVWANHNGVEIKDGRCESCKEENKAIVENIRAQEGIQDETISSKVKTARELKSKGPLQPLVDIFPQNIIVSLSSTTFMLQVIVFALLFGIGLKMAKEEQVRVVRSFIDGVTEIFINIINIIMKLAPFFIFCLLAGFITQMTGDNPDELFNIFKGLSIYSLCVLLGILLLIVFVYPLMLRIFSTKIKYRDFFKAIAPAQILAFSTSSSAATLPVTIDCVENNLGIKKRISSFVLPLGATVNMDGTSLYQAIAVIFLAQMHHIDLSLVQQLTIILIAVMSSIGSSPIPSAGIIMLIMVLEAVGLNPAWIAIIMPVDRILDMCRTAANVTSDACVTSIVATIEDRRQKKSAQ